MLNDRNDVTHTFSVALTRKRGAEAMPAESEKCEREVHSFLARNGNQRYIQQFSSIKNNNHLQV